MKNIIPLCGAVVLSNLQGVRPEAFDKVENPEVRDIIDGCTKTKINER